LGKSGATKIDRERPPRPSTRLLAQAALDEEEGKMCAAAITPSP